MGHVILLGPQRLNPTIGPILEALQADGRICVISAGWQEREGELDELSGHLNSGVIDLGIYHRAESVYAEDAELFAALRKRQNLLKDAQRLYRIRLLASLKAVRKLGAAGGDAALLRRERLAAMRSLRSLDRHHLGTIRRLHLEFERAWKPATRPAVARQRDAIAAELAKASVLLIAGGHVQVLLNRLRLFGIGSLLPNIPVIAWSAGAMVLGQRIVLFHDDPPHGAGDAEVMDMGLGAYPGVIPLPHAHRRLNLTDTERVSLFARRFSPSFCIAMDDGAQIHWRDGSWSDASGCYRMTRVGRVQEVDA